IPPCGFRWWRASFSLLLPAALHLATVASLERNGAGGELDGDRRGRRRTAGRRATALGSAIVDVLLDTGEDFVCRELVEALEDAVDLSTEDIDVAVSAHAVGIDRVACGELVGALLLDASPAVVVGCVRLGGCQRALHRVVLVAVERRFAAVVAAVAARRASTGTRVRPTRAIAAHSTGAGRTGTRVPFRIGGHGAG